MISSPEKRTYEKCWSGDFIHDTSSVTNVVVNNITYTNLVNSGLHTVDYR